MTGVGDFKKVLAEEFRTTAWTAPQALVRSKEAKSYGFSNRSTAVHSASERA